MAAKPPDAFLSYTRFNDQHDGGAISEFCRRLANAVQAVTGRPFEIFQDMEGIGIGEHWPGKLDQMLDQTRFFIPIVTPSYFNSEPCREELEKFLRAEAQQGRNDLVLPIYYIECDVLEEDKLRAADPLARTLHERQHHDWRELRFEPFSASDVRRALERLARKIVEARRRTDEKKAEEQAEIKRQAEQRKAEEEARRRAEEQAAIKRQAEEKKSEEEARRLAAEEQAEINRQADTALRGEPGTIVRDVDVPWCPEMVVVPPGEFMMGSTEAERQWSVSQGAKSEWVEPEQPQHRVRIGYPLAVGRYPVTFDEYDHFAAATKRKQPGDEGWGRGRRPVINVSWDDAKAYVQWLAAETRQPYRLLSEAEWEYACRAGTTTRFWWGDEVTSENANFGGNVGRTSEVGSYPASPFRLYDMHGNIWEWVEDRWHDTYEGAPDQGSAWIEGKHSGRVVRGGSWSYDPWDLRAAYRVRDVAVNRVDVLGFRVARTLFTS